MDASKYPDPALDYGIPYDPAVKLLAEKEDLRLIAYLCPAGVPTLGYGETVGVKLGQTCTKQEAEKRLAKELNRYASIVRDMCTLEPGENQLAALVVLGYNIGLPALRKSSVLRAHNAGNRAAAARAFGLYNKAKEHGQLVEVHGLTVRRAQEAALYLTPSADEAADAPHGPAVQAVEPESSLASSPIAAGGSVAGGAGVLSLLSGMNDHAQAVGGALGTVQDVAAKAAEVVHAVTGALGISAPVLLGIALVGVGAVVVYQRFKQRRLGFA